MNTEISINEDNSLITVFIPVKLKRNAGRKTLISPEGQASNSDRDESGDGTLLKNLVNAHRWQRMLESGRYTTISDLCLGEGISSGNIYTVIRMVTLAPDIQEAILDGRHPNHLTRANFVRAFPVDWVEQRKYFGFIP